jgi:hypothetical protein
MYWLNRYWGQSIRKTNMTGKDYSLLNQSMFDVIFMSKDK